MLSLWRLGKALVVSLWHLPREAAVALDAEGLGQGRRPERLLKTILVVTPLALLAWWGLPQVSWVITPSIEAWAVRPDPGPVARGDLVYFWLSHALAGADPVSVTKHALCMPGDRLNMIETPSRFARNEWDASYFCNKVLLNVTKPFARNGMHLAHLKWGGPIPPGLVFVGSSAANGFDSRYFGLVPVAALTRMRRIL